MAGKFILHREHLACLVTEHGHISISITGVAGSFINVCGRKECVLCLSFHLENFQDPFVC